jgi:hypothetical protein
LRQVPTVYGRSQTLSNTFRHVFNAKRPQPVYISTPTQAEMPSRMAEAMELQLCTWQEMPRVSCNGTTGCCKGIVVIRVVHEVSVAHRHQRACRARGRAPESVGHNPGAYAFLLSHFRVLTRITSFRSIHASHPTNQLHQQPAAASPTYPITSHRRTSLLQFTLTSHPHHATLSILLISFGF